MKKIGWINYSMTGEINPNNARSAGGLVMRLSFIKFLTEMGYKIVWYTPLKNDSEQYIKECQYKGEHDYLGNIIYKPKSVCVDDDVDFVIVENGPGNLMFSNKFHNMSSIGYCNNMLRTYEGVVFYLCVDLLLPFLFNPEEFYVNWIKEELQYGTPVDLVRNKYWVFLNTTPNHDPWIEKFKGNIRTPLYDLKDYIHWEFVPYTDLTIEMTDKMKFNPNPIVPLCMIGNERGNERATAVKTFYDREGAVVYGKWDEKARNLFKHAEFRGKITSDKVMGVYNNCKLHIVCGDRSMIKHGITHYPYRIMQAMMAGCPVLFQKGCVDLKRIGLLDEYEVDENNKDEKIDKILNMSPDQRKDFNESQLHILTNPGRIERTKNTLSEMINGHLKQAKETKDNPLHTKIIELTDIAQQRGLEDENEKRKEKYEFLAEFKKQFYNDDHTVHGNKVIKEEEKKSNAILMERTYGSPRWTGEILDCSMPMTFDTYNKCSYNCLYCFSYFQKSHSLSEKDYQEGGGLSCVNVDTIRDMFDMKDSVSEAYKQFYDYIRDRKVMQWGGLADQFDMFEKKHGVTLELLKILKEKNYPLCFSTKATWWVYDERYRELFRGQDNWNTKFSIINLDTDRAKRMEKGVPSPMERLQAMSDLSKLNKGGVTLRLRPFIIGFSDKNDEYLDLIRLGKEHGATAVSTEFFCLERRADERLRNRYEMMSDIVGFDILKFYKKYSHGSGYIRLNYGIKKKYFEKMEELCKKLDMRFYVSDADHKGKCHNGSCCGLDESWNYSRGQFTEAIVIAKRNGKVYWHDIEKDVLPYKKFLWNQAFGYNTGTTFARANRLNYTMYDYVREQWNTPNSPRSPYKYFSGVLMPVGLDENKNVIYEYKEK